MRRRFALVLVAAAALLGIGATAAEAATTHVYSPVPTGLARVCVGGDTVGNTLCVHL